jgi:hypothetical protein
MSPGRNMVWNIKEICKRGGGASMTSPVLIEVVLVIIQGTLQVLTLIREAIRSLKET